MSARLLSVFILLLAAPPSAAPAAEGEPVTVVKKPEKRKKLPFEITEPFNKLVTGDYAERLAAFNAMLPEAGKLAESARAEAARLRALPEQLGEVSRRVLGDAIGALDDLVAEAELAASWEKGLSPAARKVRGRTVDLTCRDKPIVELLEKASKGYGVEIELSPAARRLKATLVADLTGPPTLLQFVDWLAGAESLIYGHVGEKLVFVPAGTVELAEALKKEGEAAPKDE